MRLFLNLLLLSLCVLPLAACNDNGGSQKIGIIDINRLMRDSEPGKAGLKLIEAQQAEIQARLDKVQAKLEKNPADEEALRELQKMYAQSQQRLQAEGENIVGQIYDAIQGALAAFRASQGYDLLLRIEAAESFNPDLDVTDKLMADINKLKIDFKPLPADATQSAADNGASGETPAENTASGDGAETAKAKNDAPAAEAKKDAPADETQKK